MFVASIALFLLAGAAAPVTALSTWPFRDDYVYKSGVEKFYKLHRSAATWEKAHQICRREGAKLAYPETSQERDAFNDMQRSVTDRPIDLWLGLYATFSWRIVGKEPSVNIDDLPERPDIGVYLAANGSQFPADYAVKFPFVCEMSEDAACDATSPGYKLGPDAQSCYKLHIDQRTWMDALLACDEEGAQLTIINSQKEADYLVTILEANTPSLIKSTNGVSIGFQDIFKEGKYLTVDGHPLSSSGYEEWENGEPNNFGGPENCGAMDWKGKLNDIPCHILNPYICEKKAISPTADLPDYIFNDSATNDEEEVQETTIFPASYLKPNKYFFHDSVMQDVEEIGETTVFPSSYSNSVKMYLEKLRI